MHHRVLSLEWLNHVDSAVELGSAKHILIAPTRSSSKFAIGKRRGTFLESGVNPTAKKNGGFAMCWWRGGRLSRQLFNWKVLPRSLVSKAARQGVHFLFVLAFVVVLLLSLTILCSSHFHIVVSFFMHSTLCRWKYEYFRNTVS